MALAAGLQCNTSSLQPGSPPSLLTMGAGCGMRLLAFGKLTELPDPNEKLCLLNKAEAG